MVHFVFIIKRSCIIIYLSLVWCFHVAAQSDSTDLYRHKSPHQDYFKVMNKEQSMLKVNILEWVRKIEQKKVLGVLYLGYEHKIKKQWSVNVELAAAYALLFNQGGKTKFKINGNDLLLFVGPRYYYSLKRRMRNGLSASNLSANYISMAVFGNLFKVKNLGPNPDMHSIYNLQKLAFAPIWGIQRRILDKGYFDFGLGVKVSYGEGINALYVFPGTGDVWGIAPLTQIRLGIGL